MRVDFATCVRSVALGYLQKVYPSYEITDTPECAGPLLDFVEQDIVRIQDPLMHGNRIAVIPGGKFDEGLRAEIAASAAQLTNKRRDAKAKGEAWASKLNSAGKQMLRPKC